MTNRRRTLTGAALAIPAVTLVIAGCGGSGDTVKASTPSPGGDTATQGSSAGRGDGGQTVKLAADPTGKLEFVPADLTAKAGKVTLVMKNPSSAGVEHAVAIEGHGIDVDGNVVGPGGTSTVSATVKPGKYEIYCPFDGHKAAGMVGTLTVK